jgi:hypothetical protein
MIEASLMQQILHQEILFGEPVWAGVVGKAEGW